VSWPLCGRVDAWKADDGRFCRTTFSMLVDTVKYTASAVTAVQYISRCFLTLALGVG